MREGGRFHTTLGGPLLPPGLSRHPTVCYAHAVLRPIGLYASRLVGAERGNSHSTIHILVPADSYRPRREARTSDLIDPPKSTRVRVRVRVL